MMLFLVSFCVSSILPNDKGERERNECRCAWLKEQLGLIFFFFFTVVAVVVIIRHLYSRPNTSAYIYIHTHTLHLVKIRYRLHRSFLSLSLDSRKQSKALDSNSKKKRAMHVSDSSPAPSPSSQVYLTREQTERLKHVLDRSIPICSSPPSSSPTLNITPRHFLRQVLWKLKEHSIDITGVRLNGGAASYVLVKDSNFVYRDIDILFLIKTPLSSEQKTSLPPSSHSSYPCDVWTLIKHIVSSCLLEHITNATSTEQKTPQQYTHHYFSSVLETYAKKIIKISSEQDSWALLSLQNFSGQNLELKFVEHLKRQWQFSVDSFQIDLEPLLHEKVFNHASHLCQCPSISSITKTIRTKSLIIDAINGLTIIKAERDDDASTSETKLQQEKTTLALTSNSPLQFGFFTPSSSPDARHHENEIECQTLATITTIATSKNTTGKSERARHSPEDANDRAE